MVPNVISGTSAEPRQQLQPLATEVGEAFSPLDFIFLAGEWAAGKALTDQLKEFHIMGGAGGWGLG